MLCLMVDGQIAEVLIVFTAIWEVATSVGIGAAVVQIRGVTGVRL